MNKTNPIPQLQHLGKDSKEWLIAALDPYHDFQYEPTGLPDQRTAPSVVQIHNQSVTIGAPTIAGSGNWDASILYSGFNSLMETGMTASGGAVTVTTSEIHPYDSLNRSAGMPYRSLNIWTGLPGSTMPTGAPITSGQGAYALGSILGSDRARLVGVAFEIHNTTAEIYRQGSITVGQLQDVAGDNSTIWYTDTGAASPPDVAMYCQGDRSAVQASTVQPLLTVPGSQTWPAREGVYVVPRMVHVPSDVALYSANVLGRVPVIYGTDGKVATLEPTGSATSGGTTRVPVFRNLQPSGFSPVQVFLTGLSNQTTLTITFRTIVEYFPATGSALLPLAQPSPVYDPEVMALYSAVIREAPYAVPVGQNAAGDYFRKVARVLSQVLRGVQPFTGPYGPAVGLAAKGLTWISGERGSKVDRDGAGKSARQVKDR